MDGGAILSEDASLIEVCRSLCNHGRKSHYSYNFVGWNSRLGGLQATFLNETLKYDAQILSERRALFDLYFKLLQDVDPSVRLYQPPQGVLGNGYLLVLSLNEDIVPKITQTLKDKGISTGRVYPETLHQQAPAMGALRVSDLQCSQKFCLGVLNLPLYFGMTHQQVEEVAFQFKRSLKELT
jgi:UDP-2-acetamido-2-deoxy-ribo-hexuluronate aminotransferase